MQGLSIIPWIRQYYFSFKFFNKFSIPQTLYLRTNFYLCGYS